MVSRSFEDGGRDDPRQGEANEDDHLQKSGSGVESGHPTGPAQAEQNREDDPPA